MSVLCFLSGKADGLIKVSRITQMNERKVLGRVMFEVCYLGKTGGICRKSPI